MHIYAQHIRFSYIVPDEWFTDSTKPNDDIALKHQCAPKIKTC